MKRLLLILPLLCAPLFAQSGSITSSQCVTMGTGGRAFSVGVQVTGTWTGTLQPQVAIQGQTPVNVLITPSTTSAAQSTITANGAYTVSSSGYDFFQVCGNTVGSGTANVFLSLATGSNVSGGSVPAGALNLESAYKLAQNCFGATNCTQIFGDTQVATGVTLNSTSTIVCSTCTFTSADVGKTIWATNSGTVPFNITSLECPVTTISSIVSSTSVTVGIACTATDASATLIWGHRDGATLATLDSNGVGCVNIIPFAGSNIMIDRAIFITAPTCATANLTPVTGYPQKTWQPLGNTVNLILTPDFNWASCTGTGNGQTGVCIGSGLNTFDNTGIWGTGVQTGTNANCTNAFNKTVIALATAGGAMHNTNLNGICPGTTGVGAAVNNVDFVWYGGGAQYVLNEPCLITTAAISYTSVLDCRNDGINSSYGVTVAGVNTDINSVYMVGVDIKSTGTWQSRGTHYDANNAGTPTDCVNVESGGTFYSYGDFIGTDFVRGTACLDINGQAQLANTKIEGGSATGSSLGMGTGTLISLGGNTLVTNTLINWFSGWTLTGTDILQGSCTGTVTSASTIGLFGLGNNTTTTCTSTTTNLGPVMGKAGTLFGFGCTAGTAGSVAGDGCTVMKNNVATNLTCSLNGATHCGDGAIAHQTAFAVGDIITVKVVGGTSTTLANVKASVIAW